MCTNTWGPITGTNQQQLIPMHNAVLYIWNITPPDAHAGDQRVISQAGASVEISSHQSTSAPTMMMS